MRKIVHFLNMASRMVARRALQILLVFGFSTLVLMIFMSRAQSELDTEHAVNAKKMELLEQIRRNKLLELQKTIFENPRRPPDHTYNINVSLSEKTPLERDVPDSRPELCRPIVYDHKKLPTISVVIPFYNEALSMLLRTVHSILKRTPEELLADIILVNDHSLNVDLHAPLERYVKLLPQKVQLLKTKRREGLIRARIIGARQSSGDVIMFQDAHTENNHGWAEPLLDEIRKNPKTIIQPFVEQVDAFTIDYVSSTAVVPRGGFSWDLRYTWMEIPKHEKERIHFQDHVPFRAATLVGCALAVQRKHFFEIGAFDDAMNIWGGENIELAFRNWMCGGQVLTHPCSRVAHVFKPFSYRFDGDREKIVQKNLMRIAELWMGDHKKFFYAATYSWEFKRTFFTEQDRISLENRQELKRKLQCKDFSWYHKNIVPEIPSPPSDGHYYGEVANIKTEACWYATQDLYVGITYFCFFHRVVPQNVFTIDLEGNLKYFNYCITIDPSTWLMRLRDCNLPQGTIMWDVVRVRDATNVGYVRAHFVFNGQPTTMCVIQVTNPNPVHNREQMPQMGECEEDNEFQFWRWTYRFSWDYNFDKPL